MHSEVIHNKWVNVIALGVLDVMGAFINKRACYIDATEGVEYADCVELKTLNVIKKKHCVYFEWRG